MTYATQTPIGQVDYYGDSSDIDQYDYEDALEQAAIILVAEIMGDNSVSRLLSVAGIEENEVSLLAAWSFFNSASDSLRNKMADILNDYATSYIVDNWSYSPTEKEFYSND